MLPTSISANATGLWTIGNSLTPAEGPRALNFSLDFSVTDSYEIDARNVIQGGRQFSMAQCVYVDASGTDSQVVIQVAKSGQTIYVKGRTQGYYPIVAPNDFSIVISCADNLAVVPCVVTNYPVAPGVWASQ